MRLAGRVKFGLGVLGIVAALGVAAGPSMAQQGGVRPAAAPGDAGKGDAAKLDKGKQIFTDYSCGNCHSLADAGATGHVGPALDGDSNLTEAFVADRVTNGSGPMPGFGGQLSQDEIAALAAYVTKVATK
jgi:mono/diheme cytochrome c family protein